MKTKYFQIQILISVIALSLTLSCKKLITVPLPGNSITSVSVFTDSADANSAILGIYSKLINTNRSLSIGNGASSVYLACSADELVPYNLGYAPLGELYTNSMINTNTYAYSGFWLPAYSIIYQCNASIEGLNASTSLNASTKKELNGEATFLRDLIYFYLINIFGNVPYVTSASNWQQTENAASTNVSIIYTQLISDLKLCQSELNSDYSMTSNQRIRATQMAATALLSRIYLYTNDWNDAISQSTSVINYTDFSLDSLPNVFLANSTESILQWGLNTNYYPGDATTEGYVVLPSSSTQPPEYYLTNQLYNAFEPGDKRRTAWVDSSLVNGVQYYFSNKYTISSGNYSIGGTAPQNYMVLRLAEQYLIRAEAEANSGNNLSAIADINIIRKRAGLPNLSNTLTKAQIIAAMMQERRIEFFSEWGHRWLDLKRTGEIDSVMAIVTPIKIGGSSWKSTQQLYPIPFSETQSDPSLVQNPGY